MGEPAIGTRKWTRLEYDRLVEAEILGSEDRIELLGGHMIVKEPQYSPHATAIQLVQRTLDRAFGPGWSVRPQLPIALAEDSEPEPDVCVVRGDPRDYRDAHPERPVLIVEVSLSRLGFDREHKGSLYARAGITDYWIVNLADRRVEIYREPVPDAAGILRLALRTLGHPGPRRTHLPAGGPGSGIAVADLLP